MVWDCVHGVVCDCVYMEWCDGVWCGTVCTWSGVWCGTVCTWNGVMVCDVGLCTWSSVWCGVGLCTWSGVWCGTVCTWSGVGVVEWVDRMTLRWLGHLERNKFAVRKECLVRVSVKNGLVVLTFVNSICSFNFLFSSI